MKGVFVGVALFLVISMLVFTSAYDYSPRVAATVKAAAEVRANDTIAKVEEMRREKVADLKERIKDGGEWLRVSGRNISVNAISDARAELIAGKINARTGLNLTVEDVQNGTLGQILSARLSNGRNAEVKIMPDRASAVALARLRAKCAMENCSVELKEVGEGDRTRVAYEIKTEKDSRVFFIFPKKMAVEAQVDAETGEVVAVHKPWWAFLAKEKNDNRTEAEIEAELNVSS